MITIIKHILHRIFTTYQWEVGECAKVWCHSINSGSRPMFVMITSIQGDFVALEYLQKKEIGHLKEIDPSWWFITELHKRELKHLSYDQLDRCARLIHENRQKEYHNQKSTP